MSDTTKSFVYILLVYIAFFFLPLTDSFTQGSIMEGFYMLQDYVREHTLTCLVPALFIAGAIAAFVSQASIIKYFSPGSNPALAYGLGSVSGTVLAVCSCTVLPLFSGIYTRGAGLGPAIAFVYSGPAINVTSIFLTMKVLGLEMGVARIVGSVIFALVIGLIMGKIFQKEDSDRQSNIVKTRNQERSRPIYQDVLFIGLQVLVLFFATFSKPDSPESWLMPIYEYRFRIVGGLVLGIIALAFSWFNGFERTTWMEETLEFSKLILPMLLLGVFLAGIFLGRPGSEFGFIPKEWIQNVVGGNSLLANFVASFIGAFMYFATLTEIPILEGLMGSGMGKGPALALLLSGPALSLPNMLVLKSVIGWQKTIVYCLLVVGFSTITGYLYGMLF
ncbi:MAG: permease [Leptospira sp.]|nr:permease [Leptospira sp.]